MSPGPQLTVDIVIECYIDENGVLSSDVHVQNDQHNFQTLRIGERLSDEPGYFVFLTSDRSAKSLANEQDVVRRRAENLQVEEALELERIAVKRKSAALKREREKLETLKDKLSKRTITLGIEASSLSSPLSVVDKIEVRDKCSEVRCLCQSIFPPYTVLLIIYGINRNIIVCFCFFF